MSATTAIVIAQNHAEPTALGLCGVAGFLLAFKDCLTFLLFQSDSRMGTAVTESVGLAWFIVILSFAIANPVSRAYRERRMTPLRWIALYLGLAAISLLWTTTNSLMVAAGYWVSTAVDIGGIYILARYVPVWAHIQRIMQGFAIGAALLAAIVWIAPATEDMRLGHEDYLHPNAIGFEFAIATFFCLYLARHNRQWYGWALALFVTMVRTLSKGTIVGFLVAGVCCLLRGWDVSRKTRVYTGLIMTAVIGGFWGLVERYLDSYTAGNNLETLTGRTYIWSNAIAIAMEKPWFGHGFDSFRWVFPPFGTFQPWHAHNEWIQQFFAYGVLGIAIVACIYWSFYREIRKSSANRNLRTLATGILIMVLVRSLVDTDRFELCFPLWLMTLLSIALASEVSPETTAL